jgi:hypothetical protein
MAGRGSILQDGHLPAPIGGINAVDPVSRISQSECVYLINMIADEFGLRPRLGSREHCTGLDAPAKTLFHFSGSEETGNRLFACTLSGIWDVTTSSDSPSRVLAFGTQNGNSGIGISRSSVTTAGHYALYTDEANGYHVYSEDTDTWAKVALGSGATEILGVDPADLVFVTIWKNRVWFVEKESASAWYLDAGSIYGTATKFDFGNKFKAGGRLVGLW